MTSLPERTVRLTWAIGLLALVACGASPTEPTAQDPSETCLSKGNFSRLYTSSPTHTLPSIRDVARMGAQSLVLGSSEVLTVEMGSPPKVVASMPLEEPAGNIWYADRRLFVLAEAESGLRYALDVYRRGPGSSFVREGSIGIHEKPAGLHMVDQTLAVTIRGEGVYLYESSQGGALTRVGRFLDSRVTRSARRGSQILLLRGFGARISTDTLSVLDVSDPAYPHLRPDLETDVPPGATFLAVHEDLTLIAGYSWVRMYDMSRGRPELLVEESGLPPAGEYHFAQGRLFLLGGSTVWAFDLTRDRDLRLIASFSMDFFSSSIVIGHDWVLATETDEALFRISGSALPPAPLKFASPGFYVRAVSSNSSRLFLAGRSIAWVDLSVPGSPELRETFWNDTIAELASTEDRLYALTAYSSLLVFDSSSLELLATIERPPFASSGYAYDVIAVGNTLFGVFPNDGVLAFDDSRLEWSTIPLLEGPARGAVAHGQTAVFAFGEDQMIVIDTSEGEPFVQSTVNTPPDWNPLAMHEDTILASLGHTRVGWFELEPSGELRLMHEQRIGMTRFAASFDGRSSYFYSGHSYAARLFEGYPAVPTTPADFPVLDSRIEGVEWVEALGFVAYGPGGLTVLPSPCEN